MLQEIVDVDEVNRAGEEVSSSSYLEFLEALVHKMGGVLDEADLLGEIRVKFGPYWGPSDLRLINGRPKWMNAVDWAKVMARKLETPILSRTVRLKNNKKFTVLVVDDHSIDPEWLEWVKDRQVKVNFRKSCPKCGTNDLSLNSENCPRCGNEFRWKSIRIHRKPK